MCKIRIAIVAILSTMAIFAADVTAATGEVLSFQKISSTEGSLSGTLDDEDYFGTSVALLGDLDGDGVAELAVGAQHDDDGEANQGAVWILFLNSDGTVKAQQKISETEGGFSGTLDTYDYFGVSAAALGDLDGDGVVDLVVGARGDDDGGSACGAIWVLYLNSDGTVKSHQKISSVEGGFTGTLDSIDYFGYSVISMGDLDGDGVVDLAVGAICDDDGGTNKGAVWILFLNSDGTVKTHQKISETQGGFTGILSISERFGSSVSPLGDLDNDGVSELAVGALWDDDGGVNRGAVWIIFLNNDGTVKSQQKISDTEGGFTGLLDNEDWFGDSTASLGDLDGDGVTDLAVGARKDDDGGPYGTDRGAVWILFLNNDGTVKSYKKISSTEGNFAGSLDEFDYFGNYATSLGDLNGDGVTDLAVGAFWDDDGGLDRGAVWMLFLDSNSASVISTNLHCNPQSGTLPFSLRLGVIMDNLVENYRTFAGRVDVTIASGSAFTRWRAGYTNLLPFEHHEFWFSQNLPNVGTLVGMNTFKLSIMDVTPAPYNQPPFWPSGDTDTDSCTVTGIAP
jgi:hypothetical protein